MSQTADKASPPQEIRSTASWKLFLGLSRTPHGILDMATPALGAVLWLGGLPPTSVVVVGLITAFAGYTAVYALNDLVDYRVDKERLAVADRSKEHFQVDDIMVRHPVAYGLLPYSSGLKWFAFWSGVALVGAWWLNPFCAALFGASALLETVYCKMLRISYLKVIPSAIVKATGGLAGVYAVDPNPPLGFVAVLFLWLAAWEVGGQNVVNDIVDKDDDERVSARTTATVKGLQESVFLLLAAVSMAVFGGTVIYWFAGSGISWIYPFGAAILGWLLLLQPAREVYYDATPSTATALFNRASYMPVSFFALALVSIYLPL